MAKKESYSLFFSLGGSVDTIYDASEIERKFTQFAKENKLNIFDKRIVWDNIERPF